ncbi:MULTISPECIES: LD-carboxypeptidase [unclassified Lentimicrobium]|uniref:S66 peptidase family protein n=1 Tax=unclassified Lentimicrobium TaxID=2677434 RepID=UPI001555FFD2|nr:MULTISPECIES: LD-carboxypeptidase [unclassified Lentimicrobium]NPD46550.1 LD-carboxypeptidase [Lentimicrobium sp. S6]NPD85693.1 LD-carboxypeptidase [Lentimicrobium sp. L6]
MKRPPYLKSGDRIGLVSPARKISSQEVKSAVKLLQRWGLEPVFGRHIFSSHHQFGGKDAERTSDMQEFLDDINVKGILSTRGGYGSVRIIDQLDFSKFKVHPKWLIGYSDITVFHSHIHQVLEIETIHGTMPINFPTNLVENESILSLKQALFGELEAYQLKNCQVLREGNVTAPLIGGNLSILYSLLGSISDINTDGKILFIEDLDEYLYHMDRMMMNLKRTGKLHHLKALIVGGMNDMNDNTIPYGQSAKEIIWETVKEYDYPVIFDFPSGHIEPNMALYLGRKIDLQAYNNELKISFL